MWNLHRSNKYKCNVNCFGYRISRLVKISTEPFEACYFPACVIYFGWLSKRNCLMHKSEGWGVGQQYEKQKCWLLYHSFGINFSHVVHSLDKQMYLVSQNYHKGSICIFLTGGKCRTLLSRVITDTMKWQGCGVPQWFPRLRNTLQCPMGLNRPLDAAG